MNVSRTASRDRWNAFLATAFVVLAGLFFGPSALVKADDGAAETSDDVADEIGPERGEGSVEPSPIQRDDVLDWIDDLRSDRLSQRRQAERRLIEAGPQWQFLLPPMDDSMDEEVRLRLRRINEAMDAADEPSAADDAPIVIQLADAENLDDALEKISAASGVEFSYRGDTSVDVTSTSGQMSFWHALDYTLDQTDLDVNLFDGGRQTLALTRRHAGRPSRLDAAAYAGVYRIEPVSISATRAVRNPSLSGLNIKLEVSWVPGRTPVGLVVDVNATRGQLDNGDALLPQQSAATIDIATNAEVAATDVFLPMQLPASGSERIETLTGQLSAWLPNETHSFEIDLDAVGTTVKHENMGVTLGNVRKDGPLYSIEIRSQLESSADGLDSHHQWLSQNEVFVRGPGGQRIEHLGFELFHQSADKSNVKYLFDLGDAASPEGTLVYRSPTSLRPDEVTFVLRDIWLP